MILPLLLLVWLSDLILPLHLLGNFQFLFQIECGIHYYPNHLLSYYGAKKGELPITEQLYQELLTLPLHPGLSEGQVDFVIEKVKAFFGI